MSDREIQEIAVQALADANGDVQTATEVVVQIVKANFALYRKLMDSLLREACYSKVREVCRINRQEIWTTAQPDASQSRKGVSALAAATKLTLLDFPLSCVVRRKSRPCG
jgi:hypothetical protein